MSHTRAEAVLEILIVDDTAMSRSAILIMLKRIISSEIKVTFAINGQEAVDICKRRPKPFDIIFMDHNMPVMLGDEATKKIRIQKGGEWDEKEETFTIHPDDKCIIITCSATTTTEIGYKGKHPGANYCLNKPIIPTELREMLTIIAEKHNKCITITSLPNLTHRSSPPMIRKMGSEVTHRGSHYVLQTVVVNDNHAHEKSPDSLAKMAKSAGSLVQIKSASCNDSFFPCVQKLVESPKALELSKDNDEQNCCKKYCTIL